MNNNQLGNNLKRLREILSLSEQQFATLLLLSRSTIVNIESGKDVSENTIARIMVLFHMYSWDQINHSEISIELNLKEMLLKHFDGDTRFTTILNSRPSIRFAIEERLLKTSYLDKFRETKEIKNELAKRFGWHYTSISKTLNEMSDILEIIKSSKGGTHMYRKRNEISPVLS